jgi:hypothetical protein
MFVPGTILENHHDNNIRLPAASSTASFIENFTAADIAEPLASFDASTSATDVLAVMTRRAYKLAGIRMDGTICGYVRQEALIQGRAGMSFSHLRRAMWSPIRSGSLNSSGD